MLYQQGTQRIEVIVRKDTGAGERGAKEKDTDNATQEPTENESSGGGTSRSSSAKSRFAKVNATHFLAVAKQGANLVIDYKLQGISLVNGDQAMQEQVARKVEIVQDVGNFASSVAMGATYGAAGGVPGAVLGMIFGAASSGMSIAYKYETREREYDYKMFKEDNAIEYKRSRAQINLTTGRLR